MKVHFNRISYKNFLSSGNYPVQVELSGTKRTLIIGSNGAGKTTLTAAICFALFGKDIKGRTKGQLINSVNRKNTLVELEFSVGPDQYKICRGIKPDVFEIYRNGTMLSQDAAKKDQQKYLEQNIIRMNFNAFKQVVILGSGNYTPFMKLKAAERREIIEDLLDLNIFSVMNGVLKFRVSANKEDLRNNDTQINLLKSKIELEEENLNSLESEKFDRSGKLDYELRALRPELDVKKESLQELAKSVQELKERFGPTDEIKEKREIVLREVGVVNSKIKDMEERIEFFGEHARCPSCDQEIAEHFKDEMLEKLKVECTFAKDKRTRIENADQVLKGKILAYERAKLEYDKLMLKGTEVKAEIQHLVQRIKDISEELTQRSSADKRIDDCKTKIETLRKDLSDAYEVRTKLNEMKEMLNISNLLLKDSGIKVKVVSTYIPFINDRINAYLDAMNFYTQFELDENFNETIRARYRDEYSFESFSNGEQQRINLALLFTWREVAKRKNSVDTSLLFLDEVFESSLDQEGVEDLTKILAVLDGTNVFVISHKESMVEQFDRVLKFEKVGHFTQIKEEA